MRRLLLLGLGLMISIMSVHAQVGQGALKGTITDDESGTGVPFANIALKQKGSLVSGTATDFDGNFELKPLPPGDYVVEITSLGYSPVQITGVRITSEKTTFLDKKSSRMKSSSVTMEEFVVVENRVALVDPDGGATMTTVTAGDIGRMAARSPAELAATVGGTYSKDDGSGTINVRGQRGDANYYYIDGIKVRGSSAIPQGSIEQISVITGGIPAQYGDVTGGVISITTKGVSQKYAGGVEYLTSGVKINDNTYVGTDPYGYNLAEFSLSGPLYSIKDTAADGSDIKKPLLGFFFAANYVNQLDARPSAVGAWKVRDDVLEDLQANPLRPGLSGDQAVIPNADYLRLSDFERVDVRQNAQRQSINLSGKIDVVTTSNTNLTFGGSLNFQDQKLYNYERSLFDYENNPDRLDLDWRVFARFTQRFNSASEAEEEKSASIIKNAYYSIQADYNRELFRIQDANHQDDFFKYGYIGKFETFQQRAFTVGQDSLTGIFGNIQTVFEDTLVTFTAGDANPELSRFAQQYYELNGWEGFDAEGNPVYDSDRSGDAFSSISVIQAGGGLVNGDDLHSRGRSVYGLWISNSDRTNVESGNTNRFQESVQTQVRLSAQGSADIGNHSFVVGFEYEQRIDRSYAISPVGLWRIAQLRANTHISDLDLSNPVVVYPGPEVQYDRLNTSPGEYDNFNDDETQSFIDYNLRKATGLDPDGTSYLDVHAIDPDVYQLEYFSADELYNQGNSLVSYYGYDPYGNRTNDNPAFEDFFTERDEFGNLTRPVAPFQPIYVAGFIEDKFEFEDLIFRIGLRVDRYDANQKVLKDKYVLFPTIKAGDNESLEYLGEGSNDHPGNIGDDYVVYVDNIENPSSILGYRDGDVWYNSSGAELSDASALRVSNGLPAPLLEEGNRTLTNTTDVTAESFEDYTPQTNFLPRIAFSFPISDEANFFAHYDVLTKRPTIGNRLDPSNYYFLESRSGARIDNPALQPEKTIDYEVGFQQALNNDMALKISAFYRESRDLVQVARVADAYPIEYITYDNIDFATVKGTTITYELRRTNNLSMRVAYTLQFAEGTGSDATSQLNLATSGQPNLRAPSRLTYDERHQIVGNVDYRYSSGKDYNGPLVGNAQILKNTGVNLQMRGGSGETYNPQKNFTSSAQFTDSPNPLQLGALNSADLPWVFRFDLSVDRDFTYEMGDNKRKFMINVYAQVLNVLNSRSINNVYAATGNPDDDGYLTSPLGIQNTEEQNSPSSFTEYYTLKLWNPTNWQLPRRFRIGARVNF